MMTTHAKLMAVITVLVLPLPALAGEVSPPQAMSAMPPAPQGPYYSIRLNTEPPAPVAIHPQAPARTGFGGSSSFGFGFGNSFGGQTYGGMPYGRPFVPRPKSEPAAIKPQVQAPAPAQAPSQVVTPQEVQPSVAPDWVMQRRANMEQRRAEAQKRFTMSAPQQPMYAPQGYGMPYAPYGYVQQQQFQPQPQYGAVH